MSHAAAPVIGAGERLAVTLLFSLLVHGVVLLGVTFAPEPPALSLPALDVILVPSKTEATPEKVDFLANAAQQGGGESDESKRPREKVSSPLPKVTPGLAPAPMVAGGPPQAEATPTRVLTTIADSPNEASSDSARRDSPVPPPVTARELITQSVEMARLAAEIERDSAAYAKRPRRKFISASTREYAYAAYMRAWVARVERIGNLNYPDEARNRALTGNLVLTVAVRRDGSIERIDIIQPSGQRVLDEAAVRIVRLAAPFAPLPEAKEDIDVLHVTRTWQFLPGNVLRNE